MVIEGLWGADNTGEAILLNGVSTGISLPGAGFDNFNQLHAFSIATGFQAGINTLDFVVRDTGVIGGFRAQLSGTADPALQVPEPGTLALVALDLIGVSMRSRAQRRWDRFG